MVIRIFSNRNDAKKNVGGPLVGGIVSAGILYFGKSKKFAKISLK